MSVSRIDTRVGKGSERFPRADRVDPPASREYKPVDIHGVGAIMSCPCPVANDLRDVVVAAQETAGIDVKGLARRVGVDIRREAHNQAPPGLALLLPGRSLLDRHAFARQQVRRGEVVPHRVTGEIDRVQRVPPDVPAQARASEERRSRVRARADDRAIVAFDPHLPALEDSAVPVTRERIQDRPGLLDMHRDAVVREAVARHPGSKQQPSRAYPAHEPFPRRAIAAARRGRPTPHPAGRSSPAQPARTARISIHAKSSPV